MTKTLVELGMMVVVAMCVALEQLVGVIGAGLILVFYGCIEIADATKDRP